jgi:hypothetical protein
MRLFKPPALILLAGGHPISDHGFSSLLLVATAPHLVSSFFFLFIGIYLLVASNLVHFQAVWETSHLKKIFPAFLKF